MVRHRITAALDALEADLRRLDDGVPRFDALARHADECDAIGLTLLGKVTRRLAKGEDRCTAGAMCLVRTTRGLLRRDQRAEEQRAGQVLDMETGAP